MGADRQSGHRATVDEAARHLGLTVDAVRKRVQRGQIAHEKDAAGRVRIILDIPDNASTIQDERPDTTGQAAAGAGAREELLEELRDRVASLERQLQRRGEETERLHQIVAGLAQANAEQARTIRAIEAPASQEPPEDAETVEEEPERTESQPDAAGPQAGAETAPGAAEGDEAVRQEEPQAWEASEGDSGDRPLLASREPAEAAVVPGPAETDIGTGELHQEHPDNTPSDGPEAESPGSVEEEPEKTVDFRLKERDEERQRKDREAFIRRIEEQRDAAEAARRRPWWRRIIGGR